MHLHSWKLPSEAYALDEKNWLLSDLYFLHLDFANFDFYMVANIAYSWFD